MNRAQYTRTFGELRLLVFLIIARDKFVHHVLHAGY